MDHRRVEFVSNQRSVNQPFLSSNFNYHNSAIDFSNKLILSAQEFRETPHAGTIVFPEDASTS